MPSPPRFSVLVIDDQESSEFWSQKLGPGRYRVAHSGTVKAGLARIGQESFDALIVDGQLGDASGLDVLSEVQKRVVDLPVVLLVPGSAIEIAREAQRRGVFGFLVRPFAGHELLQLLTHAVESSSLRREVAGWRQADGTEHGEPRLLGTSAAMALVREQIVRIAPTDATVLITGESGTGKRLAARTLHALSRGVDAPLSVVACGSMPADVLETLLFGQAPDGPGGQASVGQFAAASDGTLVLDTIDEMPTSVQVKLLRALRERRFAAVGSAVEQDTTARVVAISHRDLRALVASGSFRQDLFYHLQTVPLMMPALRDRPDDIPWLTGLFLERAAARHRRPTPRLGRDAIAQLLGHRWPGNVRELGSVAESLVLLGRPDALSASDVTALLAPSDSAIPVAASIPLPVDGVIAGREDLDATVERLRDVHSRLPSLREARDQFERAYLAEVLRRSGGNVTIASRTAGRNRTDFYELLHRHNLSVADFKPD